jgi:hypothetical protein
MRIRVLQLALMAVLAIMLPYPAVAYIGPGAGLGMIGSLLAVVGALVLAIVGLIVLPFRMLMKRRSVKTDPPHQAAQTAQSQDR